MPSLHTMDTDKDPAPKKKKCLADLEEKWKRLKSEAQIQKKVYQERRVEEAQLAKEARNVPLPAEDDSDGSFNSKRNRNVTNRPPDQPSSSDSSHHHFNAPGAVGQPEEYHMFQKVKARKAEIKKAPGAP